MPAEWCCQLGGSLDAGKQRVVAGSNGLCTAKLGRMNLVPGQSGRGELTLVGGC